MDDRLSERWRVGRKVGRTIYAQPGDTASDRDLLIGVMDTPAQAAEAVDGHNEALVARSERDRLREALEELVGALAKMPDAGLAEPDPRYRWWWEVAVPASGRAREALVAGRSSSVLEVTDEQICHTCKCAQGDLQIRHKSVGSDPVEALRHALADGDLDRARTLIGSVWHERESLRRGGG